MGELHKRPYSWQPSYQKMITMIRKYFIWPNMNKEVPKYLAHCLDIQQVKLEYQPPT